MKYMFPIVALLAASCSAVDPWNPTAGHGHTSNHYHAKPTHSYGGHHHQHHDYSNFNLDIGTYGYGIGPHDLYTRVAALKLKNETLRTQITALEASGKVEDLSALIEDFFTVNSADLEFGDALGARELIDPFCVEGPGVLDFSLTATTLTADFGIITPTI